VGRSRKDSGTAHGSRCRQLVRERGGSEEQYDGRGGRGGAGDFNTDEQQMRYF
jgi:hypothetical protein